MSKIQQGTRVFAGELKGTVAWVRMAPPSYAEVAAASVILDHRRGDPGYSGSVFSASNLRPVTPDEHDTEADCTVGPDGCCSECGVSHGGECPSCGGIAFHRAKCPDIG